MLILNYLIQKQKVSTYISYSPVRYPSPENNICNKNNELASTGPDSAAQTTKKLFYVIYNHRQHLSLFNTTDHHQVQSAGAVSAVAATAAVVCVSANDDAATEAGRWTEAAGRRNEPNGKSFVIFDILLDTKYSSVSTGLFLKLSMLGLLV